VLISALAGWITRLLLTKFDYAATQTQTADSLHSILRPYRFVPAGNQPNRRRHRPLLQTGREPIQQVGADLAARRAATAAQPRADFLAVARVQSRAPASGDPAFQTASEDNLITAISPYFDLNGALRNPARFASLQSRFADHA